MNKHSNFLVDLSPKKFFFSEKMKMKEIFKRKCTFNSNSQRTYKMSRTNLILQTNLTDSFDTPHNRRI